MHYAKHLTALENGVKMRKALTLGSPEDDGFRRERESERKQRNLSIPLDVKSGPLLTKQPHLGYPDQCK